ncbi:hypothetical protein [Mesomycoplasma ovipneumoniae]|uniref:hypothetical protein n=1 Tax=Mesomycoplasma ovipneumoniae TaxID=29562 RepID=UPI00311B2996
MIVIFPEFHSLKTKIRQSVEFKTLYQQMIFKNHDGGPCDPNIWNRYDFYFDILINQ